MWKLAVLLTLGAVSQSNGLSLASPGYSAWRITDNSYGIDFWREPEGLTQSRIRAIIQTRDGYLWLGTDGGLVRFNGVTFTAFTVETGSLKDNEVWALEEDDDGGLWIGTYGGGITLLKNAKFRTFTMKDGLADDVVMSIQKDRHGDLWMTTPQGLSRYSHGVFSRITQADGLPELHVTAVCGHGSDGAVVGTHSGIYRFVHDRFEPVPRLPSSDRSVPDHLVCGGDGSLWIGFSSGAIEQHRNGTFKTFAGAGESHRLYEDWRGDIWTVQGKWIGKLVNGQFQTITIENGAPDLGSIYMLFVDREGSVWLGLHSNGLARLRTRQLSTVSKQDGLPDDRTRAVFQDSAGRIWVGTASGLGCYDGGRLSTWTSLNGKRLGDVRSIAEDAKGNLWVSSGASLLYMQNGRLLSAPGWNGTFEIEVIYKDASGKMWIGTDGGGLFEYFAGKFINYRTQDGLASNHVRAILGDRNHALWVSTFGKGLSKYSNGIFTTYSTENGLAGDRVVAMFEDEEDALWFATRRGLSRLKNGKFFTWTSESGLFTGFVYAIVDDGKGNFWFSSAQGIFRVSKQELREFAEGYIAKVVSVVWGEKDGMKTRAGNIGNQPLAVRTTAGQLMFSSMKGLVIIDPERIVPNGVVPPVYIEKVLLNRKEKQHNQYAELPLGPGELEVQYAALSYSAPDKLRFRYKLEGFDQDWIDAGGRRFTYYANLSPGRYTFRVIAGKTDGVWNSTGASYSFYFKPPFYRTFAFAVLVAISIMLLGWLVYWLRMSSLRDRYSAVLAERNRISRDIHDTLSQNLAGIALQLDAVHMQLPDVNGALRDRLDEACNLTRYSLAEARRAIADLRSDELEAPELAIALPEIVQHLAGTLQTRVEVLGKARRLNASVERDLLRIGQEALANVVKHAHAQKVEIQLHFSTDRLALRISDDGRGFDTEHLCPSESGHYGLIGMRERSERIGGQLTVSSKPGYGTELLIEVPI